MVVLLDNRDPTAGDAIPFERKKDQLMWDGAVSICNVEPDGDQLPLVEAGVL